ncbi:MAG: hypothetical protein ABUR63_10645 [Verrucomicrobiota bacterium]
MSEEKLSPHEVDYVLRRAAEIDSNFGDNSGELTHSAGEGSGVAIEPKMTADEVVRLGVEAGLRQEAVVAALAEVRLRGLIEPETGPLVKALGPSHIVVTRVVPGGPEPARRAVERFLREQLMTVRRHHGDRVEWERAQGIWPGLLRSLDFSKRYGFSLVNHVETRIVPEGSGTAITFHIDVSEMRRERMTHMGIRSLLAFALVGLGGTALLPGFGLGDVLALAGGGVAASGIFALERRRYLESRGRVQLAPERFLDLLVQRRQRLTSNDS